MSNPTFSVQGKAAIITGAGSGINYCFARSLLEKGCNVVIADLALRPEAQKLIDDYTAQPRAVFVKTDVVMWDQLTNMFDAAEKEFGGADIVCSQKAPVLRKSDNLILRSARALASSSLTGRTSGTRPAQRCPRMILTVPTGLGITLAWTST